MKLTETFSDWLTEFNVDGSAWQLSSRREGTWNLCWSTDVKIGGKSVVTIEAGWTSTLKDSHTAVINVICRPLVLKGGAEDEAVETVTVFYEDFKDHRDAEAALMKWKQKIIQEENPGVSPEQTTLAVQLWTQTSAPTLF